jgi:hypothetical protein
VWNEIKAKIHRLSELDKTRQAFGARHHRYQFGNNLTAKQIFDWEEESGVELPSDLKGYYLECGNGGAGPYYGMKRLQELDLYKANSPFLDADQLRALAKERYDHDDEDCDYYYENETSWVVPQSDYQGLVAIIEYGCGEQICAVTNGKRTGQIYFKTMQNGLAEIGSLQADFHRWLDRELSLFETVIALIDQCSSATELSQICVEKHDFYGARDYMVSYLGIAKPASLFGENENRHHGAVQFPWYDKQFPQKKKKYWLF